jgi:hypothetical protein
LQLVRFLLKAAGSRRDICRRVHCACPREAW